jgi:hypothetical protein
MEFKDKLKRGDLARIAEIAGVSRETVVKTIVIGTRNNEKAKKAARAFFEARERMTQLFRENA